MTDSFEKQPASSAAEIDEVKRMLTETNPVLLITTIVVSMLHGLFEILAFKVCTTDLGNCVTLLVYRMISAIGEGKRRWLGYLSGARGEPSYPLINFYLSTSLERS